MKHTPMICETCAYWRREPPMDEAGECRRNPPAVIKGAFEWPLTNESQWCGEYRPHGPTHQRFGREGKND